MQQTIMSLKYLVILCEGSENSVVGAYETLAEAKVHLRSIRYYSCYSRNYECLDIADDEMSGVGYDETGHFMYYIQEQPQQPKELPTQNL